MTVNATYTPAQYTGNAITTAFSFPYQYFTASDLIVNLFDTTAGANVSPQPALNGGATYDYTVAGVAGFSYPTNNVVEFASATITFNNAPPANYRITLTRSVPQTQVANLLDNAKLPASSVNAVFDRLTLITQQLLSLNGFTLQAPTNDPAGLNYTLGNASARANTLIGCDTAGNIISVGGTPLPTALVALDMPRVNAAGTAYELRTPAQVIADLFGSSTGTGAVVRSTGATIAAALLSGTFTGTYTLGGTPTIPNGSIIQVAAINLKIEDGSDTTKVIQLDASGITSGQTRTYKGPDHNGTLATQDGTEVLTGKTYDTTGSGNVFKVGGNTVSSVASLQGVLSQSQLYTAIAAAVNFNTVADTQFTITLPTGFTRWTLNSCRIDGAGVSLTTAQFGLFSGAGGTGTAIIASGTPCTVSTASENTTNNAQSQGQSIANASFNFATVQFRITNPQGVAAIGNVALIITPLP